MIQVQVVVEDYLPAIAQPPLNRLHTILLACWRMVRPTSLCPAAAILSSFPPSARLAASRLSASEAGGWVEGVSVA